MAAALNDMPPFFVGETRPDTPMLAELQGRLPWACENCGEDPELIDETPSRTVDGLTAWRRIGEAAAGNTPAARAASDEDLRRLVTQQLQRRDDAERLRHYMESTAEMLRGGDVDGATLYLLEALRG